MTEELIKYQCPSCHGPLHFEPSKQMIVCDYCQSEYEENYFDKAEETSETEDETTVRIETKSEPIDWKKDGIVTEKEVLENQSGFVCTSCGAEVVSDGNTAATECMYCGNPIVITENVKGMVKPDLILPFKINKQQAEDMLKQFYNKKYLLPKTFKDQNRIKKIAGVYVPFWLFTGKGDGRIVADGRNVSVRRSGDYRIEETTHYHVEREGSLSFEKIPTDASKKMEDNYMDGLEPYNYNELVEFAPQYMAGFFADKFDVSVEDCAERAKVRMINSTKDALRRTITGYSSAPEISSHFEMMDEDVKYAMLPVWVLNTKHEGKMYHFAINGQTGKVSGDLPIDKVKQVLYSILLTLAFFIPFSIIGYLFMI